MQIVLIHTIITFARIREKKPKNEMSNKTNSKNGDKRELLENSALLLNG